MSSRSSYPKVLLEVTFYNAKQCLGLEAPQNRTPATVKRTAPLALYLYMLTILWFAEHGSFNLAAYRKAHPWYRQKQTPSFADIRTCLRAASLSESISDAPGNKAASKKILLSLLEPL